MSARLILFERHRPSEAVYRTRLLAALALALLIVLVATRLPWYPSGERIGWRSTTPSEALPVDMPDPPPPTDEPGTDPSEAQPLPLESSDGASEGDGGPEDTADAETIEPVPMQPMVLEFAEKMPELRGGLGKFYLGMEYPPAAIARGIQGRLVLDFIVNMDGTPSNVRIFQSLHPICDSAAVRALRRTTFIPAEQEGEVVAVRMRLPVRFQLLEPGSRRDSTAQAADSSGGASGP